jgi:hypothetical protein
MTHPANLHRLLGDTPRWTDALRLTTEDWLQAHCTRDQLIAIADHSRQH